MILYDLVFMILTFWIQERFCLVCARFFRRETTPEVIKDVVISESIGSIISIEENQWTVKEAKNLKKACYFMQQLGRYVARLLGCWLQGW